MRDINRQKFEQLSADEQAASTANARLQRVFDHPGLLDFGCLSTNSQADATEILRRVSREGKEVTKDEVEEAILELLNEGHPTYFPYEFEDPSDINEGTCEEFALAVMAFLSHPINLNLGCPPLNQPELYGHTWLELKTPEGILYFDSEAEYGVEDPLELPYFVRN